MTKLQRPHPLSQSIYSGVLEQAPWKTLLKDLEEYMGVSSATIVLRRPQLSDSGYSLYLYADSENSAFEDFRTKAFHDSPFAELPEHKVFTLRDRVSDTELESLDFHKFLIAYNITDLIGFDVYDKQTDIRLRLRLVRLGNAQAFTKSDKQRLASIIPLMDEALTLYSAHTQHRFVEGFYQELLASTGIACVILNAKRMVLSANQRAKNILSSQDGLLVRGDCLHCTLDADQAKLEIACQTLLKQEPDGASRTPKKGVSISRSDAGQKWDVQIRPIDKQDVAVGTDGPALVLLIQAMDRSFKLSEARLVELFGVTPAEAKLIPHLVDGLTLTAAAAALGLSRNTARSQLSSIFTKTGVNRQTQLVKLITNTFAKQWR